MLKITRETFHHNLNQISLALIKAWKLEFSQEIESLNDPMHRWLDFRLRYIEPVPRKIVLSNKLPRKLPKIVETGYQTLVGKLRNGTDVNPYQSKTLIKFNDSSSKRRSKRTDLLWADWGITHFHISDSLVKHDDYFYDRNCSNGDSWLLFCIFHGNQVGLVDVKQHQEVSTFSNQDLVKTVQQSWPEYMRQFELNGILSTSNFTDQEIASLRKSGANPSIILKEKIHIGPGLGLSTASTSNKVNLKVNLLLNWANKLAEFAWDSSGFIQTTIADFEIEKPVFELCITERGLVLYELQSNVAFDLSSAPNSEGAILSSRMADLIYPKWTMSKYLSLFHK